MPLLTRNELLMLNVNIGPRLKKDFLKELPVELGLHVLSFVSQSRLGVFQDWNMLRVLMHLWETD